VISDLQSDVRAFRAAVAQWLRATVPADWRQRLAQADRHQLVEFQKWWMVEKNKVGLAIPHWPREYGGADLSLAGQIALSDEMIRADAPPSGLFTVALNHIPATLIRFGTEEQKQRYLPGVAQGAIWCQGFSEPNAGSDLAALRTRAVRDGDHYVVNGQKIWSSMAMHADYCILLTRTSSEGPKQKGITYFILDMKSPGIEVRPIRQSTTNAEFGEVFLNDVRIPVENRVGAENEGWTVAQATLSAERGILIFEMAERHWNTLEAFYREAVLRDAPWLSDDQLRREFVTLFAEAQAGRLQIRALLRENASDHAPGSLAPAYVKLSFSSLQQRTTDLRTRIADLEGQTFRMRDQEDDHPPLLEYLESFALTIAAGSNEIMRNLIAERGLQLPRG
jgi:alkylation response protein AidB-like acyl-CoA dehydrogenase